MKTFIALDFETASELRTTPVSVGIVFVKDGKIDDELSFFSLMNPGTEIFNPIAVHQHGLKYDFVKNSPTYVDIWKQILCEAVRNNCVVIHSTSTHLSVITKCVELYGLEKFPIHYISTMTVAKAFKIPVDKISLNNLCNYFNIPYSDSHKSLEDATVTAMVALRLFENKCFKEQKFICTAFSAPRASYFEYDNQFNVQDKYEIKVSELANINFKDKHVVFCGDFVRLQLVREKLLKYSAIIDLGITSKTNFIIGGVGIKASELTLIDQLNNSKMAEIRIIPEIFIISI